MWLNRSQALGENLLLITLLNGHALNPLLLIYPDTQRSAHLSSLIRAASVCSRWKSTRRGTTGQCSEGKTLGRAQTDVGHLYPIPPPEAQRSPERLWNPETANDDKEPDFCTQQSRSTCELTGAVTGCPRPAQAQDKSPARSGGLQHPTSSCPPWPSSVLAQWEAWMLVLFTVREKPQVEEVAKCIEIPALTPVNQVILLGSNDAGPVRCDSHNLSQAHCVLSSIW